ncbi:MAG: hypothetical protein AAB540_01170 [Patescibacteria group bacterium]
MEGSDKNKLIVGMATGWEKSTATKAGPIGEVITQKAFDLAVEHDAPVIFLGGNGGGDGLMPEADRMENYFARLSKESVQADQSFVPPDVYTDTGLSDTPESDFEFSHSTYENIQNLVRSLRARVYENYHPTELEVVALDAHLPRVIAIIRHALKEAGMIDDIKMNIHPIKSSKALYTSRNGQYRLWNETAFKAWTSISHFWSFVCGDVDRKEALDKVFG